MKHLASTAVERPVTTLMFYVGVVLLGVIAFQGLPVDFLPPITIPKLTVQTIYLNVSPEEIDRSVTEPVEATLGTVAGVRKLASVSREGLSVVTAEFYWGTNMDFALLEVREKLDQRRSALPREAGRPTILRIDPSTEPIMTVAVSSGTGSASTASVLSSSIDETHRLVELKEAAGALIKRRIEQVEGVAQASVLGGFNREIRVEIDADRLQAMRLTLDQVSRALLNANLNLPGGTIKRGLFRYSLRTLGEFSNVDQVKDVAVARTEAGREIKIKNIGTVTDGFGERTGVTRYNGREIIAIQVRKEAGANTVSTSRKIHDVLSTLEREYPALKLDVVSDQAEFIGKSIADVKQAIVLGAILAFLVLFLFLRELKYLAVIGITMPISIITTFAAMYFLNITLNVISLAGLALGIGMLGDNAIVVVENMTRLREQGMRLREAAVAGAREISLAVTASTLTNVAIFLPIVFVGGIAQQLFFDMGVTMTISLLVSLLVAVTLVPMLVSRSGRRSLSDLSPRLSTSLASSQHGVRRTRGLFTRSPRLAARGAALCVAGVLAHVRSAFAMIEPHLVRMLNRISDYSYRLLDRYLSWALKKRLLTILGTILIFMLSIVVALLIPGESAPEIDQSRFTVQFYMPKGTDLEGISSLVRRLESALLATPGVADVYSASGITQEEDYWTVSSASLEKADLEVRVRSDASTAEVTDRVRRLLTGWQKSFHGVEFSVRSHGTTFEQILRPEPNDIKIRVFGKDPGVALQIAGALGNRLGAVKGLTDLRSATQQGEPEYRIVIDRENAARFGLTVRDVAQHISAQVRGTEATYLGDFDRKITIRVQPTEEQRSSIEELLNSTVRTYAGSVPLRELVQVHTTEGYGEIWRNNQQRAAILLANVHGRSVSGVVGDVEEAAAGMSLPAGYTFSVGGENEEIRDSFRGLIIIIILSIFLVYMILAAEYESILYPLVIILTSPLAFIGAIFAMVLAGQHYNVISLVGIAIMVGAVDNEAVIAVDIITELRRDGVPLADAIRKGMRLRLRPILMTTATTVLGVIPLVLAIGTGSELVQALAIPLVGGLIASTLFSITTIPVVYTYIDRWAIGRTRSVADNAR
ncbi:MAG: hypothetical protein COS95_08975 [Ignavibacteriales bacterium CG07_land_8_20_14_0_80_59_12]|nr:MAG: hypothetical protein COS95_08975 [Ignavibacteriales bacterium CG07_land_8_20_14_0_80_59_12]